MQFLLLVPIPETNEYNASGGVTNDTNLTISFAQHNPFLLHFYPRIFLLIFLILKTSVDPKHTSPVILELYAY